MPKRVASVMDSFVLIPFIVSIFQGRIRHFSILQLSDALTHIGIQMLNHLVTRLQTTAMIAPTSNIKPYTLQTGSTSPHEYFNKLCDQDT